MTDATPFERTFTSLELTFDHDWAEFQESQEDQTHNDRKYIDLTARDGNAAAYVSLTIEEAQALCDLVNKVVEEHNQWLESRSTTEQENQ